MDLKYMKVQYEHFWKFCESKSTGQIETNVTFPKERQTINK
jgi:hypothetical protein